MKRQLFSADQTERIGMTGIKAVFFDMDGVLIDTEKYYHICWRQALEEAGFQPTTEQVLCLRSCSRPFGIPLLHSFFGEGCDYDQIRKRRKELMAPMLEKEGIQMKPGADQAVRMLRERGYQTVVVTASDLERTTKYLGEVGMLDAFDHLVCASMVETGKPAPDIYRYALRVSGFRPEEVIALEDSDNGIRSAAGADLKTIFVPDLSGPNEESAARILYLAKDLPDAVRFICADEQ